MKFFRASSWIILGLTASFPHESLAIALPEHQLITKVQRSPNTTFHASAPFVGYPLDRRGEENNHHEGNHGNGNENGHGTGNGNGNGYGYVTGNGYGSGNRNGHGNGYGNGYGNGNGNGYGNGYGNGNGNSYGNGNNGYGNDRGEHRDGDRYSILDTNGVNNNGFAYQWLNAILGLERLKVAFYEHNIELFKEDSFGRYGFPPWVRGRYCQILEHEKIHVRFLEEAIGYGGLERVEKCKYRFQFESPWEFAQASEVIETVVGSAFIGGIQHLNVNQYQNHNEYTTAIASILAVDERHAAWIGGSVLGRNPWNTAFETPLTVNQAYTALEEWLNVRSCPESNHRYLPENHRVFPRLIFPRYPIPGSEVEVIVEGDYRNEEHCYAAFLYGQFILFVRIIEKDGKSYIHVPHELKDKGTVYVIIVRGGERPEEVRILDENTLAGPAVALFPFDAFGNPIRGDGGHQDQWGNNHGGNNGHEEHHDEHKP